jgi:4-amino-4-deoxy-L-arabinose transferase-like glycosyltransferase
MQNRLYTARPQATEWLVLLLIVAIAILLRLGLPHVAEFKQDEANLSRLAIDMAAGRTFPLLGIDSSVGIRNAPVSVYILAIPYRLSSDPLLAGQFVAWLNVLAVLLSYAFTRRYWGPTAAIIAALLYAASPWAAFYSRKLWAQDLLPFFVLLVVWAGSLAFLEGKRWAQWLHLPLLAITGQIHYATFTLIPITGYLLFLAWRQGKLSRAFWGGVFLALLTVIPYAVGFVQGQLWANLGGLSSQPNADLSPINPTFALLGQMVAGLDLETVIVGAPGSLPDPPLAVVVGNGLAFAVILAFAYAFVQTAQIVRKGRRANPLLLILLLWLLGVPLAFWPTWTKFYTHYLIATLPAAFILLGVVVGPMIQAWQAQLPSRLGKRILLALAAALLALPSAVGVTTLLNGLHFADWQAPADAAFGLPLGRYMPLRQKILDQKPDQVLAQMDGQFVGFNPQASIWDLLLADVPLVRFLEPGIRVYPTDAGKTLLLAGGCTGNDDYVLRQLPNGQPDYCYRLTLYDPASADFSQFSPYTGPAYYANGLRILATHWDTNSACLEVLYQPSQAAAGPKNDFFNVAVKFIDAAGVQVAEADSTFWNGRYWRAGDRIVRQFCLPDRQPASIITAVRLGLYTYLDTPMGRQFYDEPVLANPNPDNRIEIALR